MTTNAAPQVIARILCLACAVIALGLALGTVADLYMSGFPDGHLTDYAKAVNTPKHLLVWVEFAAAALFIFLALVRMSARARLIAGFAALGALILLAMSQWVGFPWYFGTHLGLDNGIGG